MTTKEHLVDLIHKAKRRVEIEELNVRLQDQKVQEEMDELEALTEDYKAALKALSELESRLEELEDE